MRNNGQRWNDNEVIVVADAFAMSSTGGVSRAAMRKTSLRRSG
jgi:hypothetical protein